ncbi:MAG: tetratricopeptide repeat protein [Candidatus Omnitrophica bacterium]|nr:tetratricopeptide repeat protein [Candidatus Omnitrophota bacterium]
MIWDILAKWFNLLRSLIGGALNDKTCFIYFAGLFIAIVLVLIFLLLWIGHAICVLIARLINKVSCYMNRHTAPKSGGFQRYIYSSAPLQDELFDDLTNGHGIFQQNFFANKFRGPILSELENSFRKSEGGMFLVSGYRGVGKTTFLNYIFRNLRRPETRGNAYHYRIINLNMGGVKPDLKFELIYKTLLELKKDFDALYWRFFIWCFPWLSDNFPVLGKIRELEMNLLWQQKVVQSQGGGAGNEKSGAAPIILNIKSERTEELQKREKSVFYEEPFRELIRLYKKKKQKIVFVLDELDKLSDASLNKIDEKNKQGKERHRYQHMDYLLGALSEIKSLLFESGVIFVLVVNKDVYDYWRHHHSQEDLFMNLVTHVEYIPCYRKEEMRLQLDFPIRIDRNVVLDPSDTAVIIREYFEVCAYYESYSNPRLYFQLLARKITNDREIVLTQGDVKYLRERIKLFELNDLLYRYVYDKDESVFSRLFVGIEELRKEFTSGDLFKAYVESVEKNYNQVKAIHSGDNANAPADIKAFWAEVFKTKTGVVATQGVLSKRVNSFLGILKERDFVANYPYTNYLIRRLTDFVAIIEERNFVSIDDIIAEMDFREFEFDDIAGQFLICLFIPLGIVILRNNGALEISGRNVRVKCNYSDLDSYHAGCEYEWDGNFDKAFDSYNKFIKDQPYSFEAHYRKTRMLYYMLVVGFYHKDIDVRAHWADSLLKLKDWMDEGMGDIGQRADHEFLRWFFFEKILLNDTESDDYAYYAERLRYFEKVDMAIDELYVRAIAERPDDASARMRYGTYLFWNKRYVEALDRFNESDNQYKDTNVLIRIADTYSMLNDYENAKKFYMSALRASTSWLQRALIIIGVAKAQELLLLVGKDLNSRKLINSALSWVSTGDLLGRKDNYFRLYGDSMQRLAGCGCTIIGSNAKKVKEELSAQMTPTERAVYQMKRTYWDDLGVLNGTK